jgi:ubiquinone/menaquinone biosynthesis C-methylase UbiE
MQDFVDRFCKDRVRVLDLGSCDVNLKVGNNRNLHPNWEYIGADICNGNNVNIVLDDPYKWDFQDNEFDVVISSNTFEHIEYPWLTIVEMTRVLKPNGYMCIIVPLVCPTHVYPVDTYRYNEDGMRALAKWANLEVIETGVFYWQWNKDLCCASTRLIARKK